MKSFEILNGHCHSPSVVLEVPVQLKKKNQVDVLVRLGKGAKDREGWDGRVSKVTVSG